MPRICSTLFQTIAALVLVSPPALAQSAGDGAGLPAPAQSWGGLVRSGAGSDYPKIGSLREGDPVTILAPTGVMWNGYEWFKIRYGGSRTGYQWGGILCPIGAPLKGTYQVCEAKAATSAQQGR